MQFLLKPFTYFHRLIPPPCSTVKSHSNTDRNSTEHFGILINTINSLWDRKICFAGKMVGIFHIKLKCTMKNNQTIMFINNNLFVKSSDKKFNCHGKNWQTCKTFQIYISLASFLLILCGEDLLSHLRLIFWFKKVENEI